MFFVESYFSKIVNAYSFYLPLEKVVTMFWRKFESPSPKDAVCQVCLKLVHRFEEFKNIDSFHTDRHMDR